MEDDKRNANLHHQYDYFHSIESTTVNAFIGGDTDIIIIVTDVNGPHHTRTMTWLQKKNFYNWNQVPLSMRTTSEL